MDEWLKFTIKIAHEAGELARKMRASPDKLDTKQKGHLDLVTAADHAVEKLLRDRIREFDSDAAVLGEESGLMGEASRMWIVDPIDGTFNFSRGMTDWAISIAYWDGTALTHGVIHAPDMNLTASAATDSGAFLNDKPVKFQATQSLGPVVALGYSPRTAVSEYLDRIERLLEAGIEHRRHGAATIGFLGVLAGWFDAYYEPKLNIWDAAAGLVLVKAAGGTIRHDPIQDFLAKPSDVLVENADRLNLDWL